MSTSSSLEQYRVADFLDWDSQKLLILNPEFQRRSVWTPSARILLIDTVLRQLPMPKVFIRTKIDVRTKKAIREVVDGQQRLRAIIDFTKDRFALSKRAREFNGLKFSTMPSDLQETFLSYPIAVDQLINASDSQVLEVFARLNSYNVSLNPAELRHAKYSGDFKWAVHDAARRWDVLWSEFGVISNRARLRMLDDSLLAEMFGVLLEGVRSGDQRAINKLYQRFDSSFPDEPEAVAKLDRVVEFIVRELHEVLVGPLASPPHFLMLFAAVSHALVGIPPGELGDAMPQRSRDALGDIAVAKDNLTALAAAIEAKDVQGQFGEFVSASMSNAHRMTSRSVRFPVFWRALLPRPLYE